MKRVGHLFEAIVDMDNLRLAFMKASRGKRFCADQRAYQKNLDFELLKLKNGLIDGTYQVGRYKRFRIFDPKEREICAAAFGERVLHHALMNVCEKWFDRWLVERTFACRKGFGQLRALTMAGKYARSNSWYLKCDFKKYFDSIPHKALKDLLQSKFKDERVLYWFGRIIDSYETSSGRGLPIGNLTSQHFANLYLDKIDRLFPGVDYVRFMDDFVLWGKTKDDMLLYRDEILDYSEKKLWLTLKAPVVNRTSHGMDFLGMRIFPTTIRANRRSIDRYRRRLRAYEYEFAHKGMSESVFQSRITALTAFLKQGDTLSWRQKFFGSRREASGSNRVIRGGSYNNDAGNCTSSNRNNNNPSNNNNNNNGFRLACSAAPQEQTAVPVGFQFPICRDKYIGGTELVEIPKTTFRRFSI